jgi:hypothetical protein
MLGVPDGIQAVQQTAITQHPTNTILSSLRIPFSTPAYSARTPHRTPHPTHTHTPMALRDLSCYTLSIRPSPTDRSLTELVELESDSQGKSGAGTPRYARVIERREGEAYSSIIYGKSGDGSR